MLAVCLAMVETEEEKTQLHDIYIKYNRLMLKVAWNILENREDAEDAVQNAFLGIAKCIKQIPSGNQPKLLRAYVCLAAKNAALSIHRQNQKRYELQEQVDDYPPQTDEMFQRIVEAGDVEWLRRMIKQLPKIYQEALFLTYCMGHTQNKAAIIAGCSAANFRQRIVRGKKQLIKLYQKEGYADD